MNTQHYPAVNKEVTTKETGNFIVGDDSNIGSIGILRDIEGVASRRERGEGQ